MHVLFAVDTSMAERSEVLALPKRHRVECVGLWTMCGSWSAASYEPGYVPAEIVRRWDRRLARASKLTAAGVWADDTLDEEVGYQMATPAGLCHFVAQTPRDAATLRKYREWLRERDGPRRRRWIPTAVRMAIYERDGFACVECGATDDLSLDHIWPWSRGGRDSEDNLRTLCRSCNSRKGAKV